MTSPIPAGNDSDRSDAGAPLALPEVDLGRRFVRVRGQQDNGFIEFDFSVGWPDLVVELVLAPADFDTFCRENDVQLLPPGSEAASASALPAASASAAESAAPP